MFLKKIKNKNRGSMMVEIIIAASIISASVLGAMAVAQKAVSLSRQSVHVAQASFLLEEGAEAVRIIRDNAWTNISSLNTSTDYYLVFSGGTWSLSATPSQIERFTRKVRVSNVNRNATSQDISASGTLDAKTKLISVSVSYFESGETKEKTLSFYIMDIFS
jgi:Tfp pilus assembly protein PilV